MLSSEQARELPVAAAVEVLVVGGGPAGVAAAFSAARLGRSTLIVEQFNCLGGVATAGGHGHTCLFSQWGNGTRVVGGIPWESLARVCEAGYGRHGNSDGDFEALGSLRVMPQCGVMGQAAGTAAALSIEHQVMPRAIDVPELQRALRAADCIVADVDIVAANASPGA